MKRLLLLILLLATGGAYAFYVAPGDKTNPQKTIEQTWRQLGRGTREAAEKIRQIDFERVTAPLAAPQPAAKPQATQLARYEKMLCDLANAERKKRGLSTLATTPALADAARAHSREMMQKNYFAHESPTASLRTPMDRYQAKYGRKPRLVAENIYKLEGPKFYRLTEKDFRRAHAGWMKSEGHRANILRTEPLGGPTQIGVGIVVKDGAYWATQMFARPAD